MSVGLLKSAEKILFVRSGEDRFEQGSYIVHPMADAWREQGIAVDVTNELSEPTGPDTLVFPHFDLTVTPPQQQALLSQCARVVNRRVTDISKRSISRQLVTSARQYDGPVIVKTDRNFGGFPELKAAHRRGGLQRCKLKVLRRLPWTWSGLIGVDGYRVYDHPRQVPWIVWRNPRFVVERFLPEREDGLYYLRQYVFLGPCEITTRSASRHPLVKSSNVIRREILDDVPAELRAFRKQLGFDYGKFDYVMSNGKPVIFDVNRTPTYDPSSKAGSANALIAKLAPGIQPLMEAS